jgi:hypothetical protein
MTHHSDIYETALKRLENMGDHHPAFVMYSEAKILYKLIPSIHALLAHALTHDRDVDNQFLLADEKEILAMAEILAVEQS